METKDIVESLDKIIHATNPHLKGRLISTIEISEPSESFAIMKRIKAVVWYFNPETKNKFDCFTVQEVMRMPKADKEIIMNEFSKRFLVTAFMWTSSKIYNDLISGKFDIQQSSD